MKRYKITNKVRFTIFVVSIMLIIGACVGLITGSDYAQGSSYDKYETVTIIPGDTVWTIAEDFAPEGKDIREYVYEICKANNITAADLKIGAEIKVPLI